jgi:two-component system osmolarity sensor histidine kinase EnvZ
VKLLPGSLLWRSFLLIAALMLLSVLTWFFIFTQYERGAARPASSQLIVSVVNLTRTALIAARPEARMDLLRELSTLKAFIFIPPRTTTASPNCPIAPSCAACGSCYARRWARRRA